MELFKGKAPCILCHNGPNFTDSQFHNLGVPAAPLLSAPLVQAAIRFDAKRMNVAEYQSAREDPGRYLVTKEEKDRGAFRTPTLRHGMQREPYMHHLSLAGGNPQLSSSQEFQRSTHPDG